MSAWHDSDVEYCSNSGPYLSFPMGGRSLMVMMPWMRKTTSSISFAAAVTGRVTRHRVGKGVCEMDNWLMVSCNSVSLLT
jgi:hypothetical protein